MSAAENSREGPRAPCSSAALGTRPPLLLRRGSRAPGSSAVSGTPPLLSKAARTNKDACSQLHNSTLDKNMCASLETFANSIAAALGQPSSISKLSLRSKSSLRKNLKDSRRKSPPPVNIFVNLAPAPPAPPLSAPSPPEPAPKSPIPPPAAAPLPTRRRPPLGQDDLRHRLGTLAQQRTPAVPNNSLNRPSVPASGDRPSSSKRRRMRLIRRRDGDAPAAAPAISLGPPPPPPASSAAYGAPHPSELAAALPPPALPPPPPALIEAPATAIPPPDKELLRPDLPSAEPAVSLPAPHTPPTDPAPPPYEPAPLTATVFPCYTAQRRPEPALPSSAASAAPTASDAPPEPPLDSCYLELQNFVRSQFDMPPLSVEPPARASPGVRCDLYRPEAPGMDYCRPAPPDPAPPAPVPAPCQRVWAEDYAAARDASRLHARGIPSMVNIPLSDPPSAPPPPAQPAPAQNQRTWAEDYAAARHASLLHAHGRPSMVNIPVPGLPPLPTREHLAATLGLDSGDYDDTALLASPRMSPVPAETSDMDISPGTRLAPVPPRITGPPELPPTTRRRLSVQLAARGVDTPSGYSLDRAVDFALGTGTTPADLIPRVRRVLAEARFGDGIFLRDLIHVANLADPPPLAPLSRRANGAPAGATRPKPRRPASTNPPRPRTPPRRLLPPLPDPYPRVTTSPAPLPDDDPTHLDSDADISDSGPAGGTGSPTSPAASPLPTDPPQHISQLSPSPPPTPQHYSPTAEDQPRPKRQRVPLQWANTPPAGAQPAPGP